MKILSTKCQITKKVNEKKSFSNKIIKKKLYNINKLKIFTNCINKNHLT